MGELRIEGMSKRFGETAAVDGVSLEADEGEILTLLGPSGCGKSTLLRLVAGLERPDAGRVLLDGEDVTALPPARRDVAMVFQSYALYPHMSVERNISVNLRLRGVGRDEIRRRVGETAELLGVGHLLERKPRQLSGGQRQRVALARAIIRQPRLFLLDEPLSNLDAQLRERTRRELGLLFERLGITVVYVTHDQSEALTLAHRIAVMRRGGIEQVGTPEEIYDRPATRFVAGFVGSPPMNRLRAEVQVAEGGRRLVLAGTGGAASLPAPAGVGEGPVELGVRPEDLRLRPAGEPAEGATGTGAASRGFGSLDAEVVLVESLGSHAVVTADLGGARLLATVERGAGTTPSPGDRVTLEVPADRLHLFAADGGERLAAGD